MKFITKFLLIVITISFFVLIPLRSARADAAPPMNPPGGDVSPEGDTEVQMVAEQVTIDFRSSTDDSAKVTAWFLFHNTGSADEHLMVRFPLNGDERTNSSGQDYIPLIQDLTAAVDGQQLPTRVYKDTDPNAPMFFLGWGTVMYWSEFPVDFPVGKDVKLVVMYTLKPTTEYSYNYVEYLLATGAGWKGPIGKADVILRFPYILNVYNLPSYNDYNSNNYFINDSSSNPQTVRSTKIVENELWLHWENLEPTDRDNVFVSIVQPHLWQNIVLASSQVIDSPDDASAWLALARAYAAAGQDKHINFTNDQLAQAFIQAFERTLTLNPNNASLHAEFANDMLWTFLQGNDYYQSIFLNELASALALDPKNADALSLEDTMHTDFPGMVLPTPGPFPTYVSPTPTQEPTAIPTSILPPTYTIVPTYTLIPSVTPFQTRNPTTATPAAISKSNQGSLNISGWLIILVAVFASGMGSGFLIFRNKKS